MFIFIVCILTVVTNIFLFHSALARKLTYSLAASFQEYSKRVNDVEQKQCAGTVSIFDLGMSSGKRKKFAIDLRTPEQIKEEEEEEQQQETEA